MLAERRVMEIKEAYPCRRVAGSDSGEAINHSWSADICKA